MPEISQTLSKKMIKKFLSIMLLGTTVLTTNAQTQLYNGGFEEWESVTYSGRTGDEPVKWSSFLDGTGSLKNMAGYDQLVKSTDTRPGSTGSYSAKLTSRAVKMMGVTIAVAQGNLTTGCVNMGSTTATAATGNYNYINYDREDQAMTFTGHPDAVKFWTKFKGDKTGNVEVVLTTSGYYQSPEANQITATKVAHAQNDTIPSNDTWTEYTVPFEYSASVDPEYVLVNVSTCATPGAGKEADYMYIDDIEMVYYHALSDLKYNGQTVAGFNESTISYDLTDQVYDESKVSWTVKGHAATVSKAFNATTGKLRLTVKNNDSGESTVYTLSFKTASATLFVSTAAKYATFIAPFNLSIPSSITVDAYTVDNINANGTLVMTKLGKNIPANIPVVLYSTRTSDYTRTASGAFVPATNNLTEGLLTGTYEEINAPVDSYVMQNHDGRVGFFHVAAGKQPKVAPNRCYLTVPAGSAAPAFFFEEDETNGIGNIEMTTDNTIYDLQGRRVATPTKGLYIINGKKVVIR